MSENFEILKNIDNEELYSKTYITYNNLDNIKNKNFSEFSRYKFNGFIEILSKRLKLNLDELKDEANAYFDTVEPIKLPPENEETERNAVGLIFNKKVAILAGVVSIIIALSLAIFIALNSNKQEDIYPPAEQSIEEPILAEPINNILPIDTNETDLNETNNKIDVIKNDIKIVPTKKIWIGIINLDTKEKIEYTTSDAVDINKSKNQIIVIKDAYLSLMVGDTEKKYDLNKRVRFICKDGQIEEISYEHFKSLNNGKAW